MNRQSYIVQFREGVRRATQDAVLSREGVYVLASGHASDDRPLEWLISAAEGTEEALEVFLERSTAVFDFWRSPQDRLWAHKPAREELPPVVVKDEAP